jgi:lysophospholipase L1-like esterase
MTKIIAIVALGWTILASSRAGQETVDPGACPHPVRVACVGASITQGVGAHPGKSYPEQLQAILGKKWIVKNFGVSGRTMTRKGDSPYWTAPAFKAAHDLNPNIVVILLGTNDTKPNNWKHHDEFYGDCRDLIESFKELPAHPHVFICRLPPVTAPGNYGIVPANLKLELPLIEKAAAAEHAGLIDVYGALLSRPRLFPDHVHPNDEGAAIIAQTVARAIEH